MYATSSYNMTLWSLYQHTVSPFILTIWAIIQPRLMQKRQCIAMLYHHHDIYSIIPIDKSRRDRDRMVAGFITTYAIHFLSPLTLWVRIPLRWGVLDITLCDNVYHWLTIDRWFSSGTTVSPSIHLTATI